MTEMYNQTLDNGIVDYAVDSDADGKQRNVSSNLVHSEEVLIKPAEEWLATNPLWPIGDKPTNSNTVCNGIDGDDPISCYTENYTCVGEPEYCNLTEEEYHEMLYDYIFPTFGEWILIGFHTIVFLVGLVSNRTDMFY